MDIHKLEVHPSADIFPMIPKEELQELADDIKANGLIHPIIIKDGLLIDGRNRREACRIAGIEPEVQELNGQDINAYIIASNINRRHMTKGQRAMAVAKIYPEAAKVKRKDSGSLNIKELNGSYISQARTVLKHLPDLADNVLSGGIALANAYEDAKDYIESTESDDKKLEKLQAKAPEIANKVIEGDMELNEAVTEYDEKLEKEKVERMGWWSILKDMDFNTKVFSDDSAGELVDNYREYNKETEVDLKAMIIKYQLFMTKLEELL